MKTLSIITAAGLLGAGLAFAQTTVQNPTTGGVLAPTEIQIDDQERAAKRPPEGKQVQAMTIALTFDKGVVRSAEVVSSRRVNSIAPKVFLRRSGDWMVTLRGGEPRSFFVSNPGRREAELGDNAAKGYEWVEESGTIEWPLVVPLYFGNRQLDPTSIIIRDVETKQVILQANLG